MASSNAGSITLPFALVAYLGVRDGGHDVVARGEIGVAVWWVILLGLVAGVLAPGRPRGRAWVVPGLLAALAAWTLIGSATSESAERSVTEAARVLTYLGIVVIALLVARDGTGSRIAGAVGAAAALIGLLALCSELFPGTFGEDPIAILPDLTERLSFPLGYWNGLGALLAIGLPLLVVGALQAGPATVRALAGAGVAICVVALYLTYSRGAVAAAAVALFVMLWLYPSGVVRRVVERLPARAWVGVGAAVLAAFLALGGAGKIADRWEEFKVPATTAVEPGAGAGRFESASGSGRYQFWSEALDAGASEPLTGIGAGAYEFWWRREGELGPARDAHSLYLEAFAELGVPGAVLVVALVGAALYVMFAAARRASGRERAWAAAIAGAGSAFALTAALDWVWELAVIPAAFLLLVVAALRLSPAPDAPPARHPPDAPRAISPGGRARTRVERAAPVGVGIGALLASVVIALPMLSTRAVRASQDAAGRGDLAAALGDARRAGDYLPFAATPKLQEALVLELAGDLAGARAAAAEAVADEPTNWRTWFIAARLAAFDDDTAAAVEAFERARSLNPNSPLLQAR